MVMLIHILIILIITRHMTVNDNGNGRCYNDKGETGEIATTVMMTKTAPLMSISCPFPRDH